MKPLLFYAEGGTWRCRPSWLSSEVAFKRIQRGSTFGANGIISHGTELFRRILGNVDYKGIGTALANTSLGSPRDRRTAFPS